MGKFLDIELFLKKKFNLPLIGNDLCHDLSLSKKN